MAVYRTKAVVLKTTDLGESDKVVTIMTKDRGKLRVVARGVRRFRSRLVGGTLPFCYSDFMVYEGRTLDWISQCEILESFMPLRDDLVKMAYASYIAELTSEFLPEGDVNEKVFLLILKTFRLMARGFDHELLTRVYELRLLNFLGYSPELKSCACCGADVGGQEVIVSPEQGGVVCNRCVAPDPNSVRVSSATISVLISLASSNTSSLKFLKIPPAVLAESTEVLRRFIIHHLEKKPKSLRFLETVHQLKHLGGD